METENAPADMSFNLEDGLKFLSENPPAMPKPADPAPAPAKADAPKPADPAPVEPKVEPKADKLDTDRRFREVAQRDRQFREAQEKWKAEVAAKEKALEERAKRAEEFEALVSSKDIDAALKRLNISYEDLAVWKATGQMPAQTQARQLVDPLVKQLAEQKAALEEFKRQQAEQKEKEQIASFKYSVAEVVRTSTDESFEFLRASMEPEQVAEEVVQVMTEFHKAGQNPPKLLDILAKMEDAEEQRVAKLAKATKFGKKFGSAPKAEPAKPAPAAEPSKPGVQTSNSLASAPAAEPDVSKMDENELIEHLARTMIRK